MKIQLTTKKEILILLHNKVLTDFVAVEVNLKCIEEEEILQGVQVNPQMENNKIQFQNKLLNLKKTLTVIIYMFEKIKEEKVEVN